MPTLNILATSARTFTLSGATYLVPARSLGSVVGADATTTSVNVEWEVAARDASGTFSLVSDVVEEGVALADVVAPEDVFSIWS